jgi:gamma-glutamylcyclotransferase (GGCT)/AIG2-like uncharacterized protein YtfP
MAVELLVNGTLMRGLALHHNLEGATFLGAYRTASRYRLYSINDIHPGMFEVETGGISVAGEMYRMGDDIWRRVEAGEPPHLYRGPVRLSDVVDGILFPRSIAEGRHKDISEFGDWRTYIASLKKA